jgi:hypothetical protein
LTTRVPQQQQLGLDADDRPLRPVAVARQCRGRARYGEQILMATIRCGTDAEIDHVPEWC